MAKTAPKLRKTLSQTNLALLGAERLADLLVAAAAADPALKRTLRLELAAELGAGDLAQALDKRLAELATSRARISWRKRPELLRELALLRSLVVDRLGAVDAALALPRLIAWFDLQEPLQARVKDPREELAAVFEAAALDLGPLAAAAGQGVALKGLGEAISTRSSTWAPLIARAMSGIDTGLAANLLDLLTANQVPQSGRFALVVRRLADRIGDVDVWLDTFDQRTLLEPETQIEAALRLSRHGRGAQGRAALDAALLPPVKRRLGWQAPQPIPVRSEAWLDAEIAVLDAEGRTDDAMTARWLRFERQLSVESLNDILSRLDDFEDVIATDRALAFAAGYYDIHRSLGLMMELGALREAAEAISIRQAEITGRSDASALWASRLGGRYPQAALVLIRARATTLAQMAGTLDGEGIASLLDEAQSLAHGLHDADGIPSHSQFVEELEQSVSKQLRSVRAGR